MRIKWAKWMSSGPTITGRKAKDKGKKITIET